MQTLKGAVAEYLEYVTALKSKSSQTQEKLYFRDLENFIQDIKLTKISHQMMEKFQASLLKSKKPQTVNRQFTVYNHFFKKCVHWHYIDKSPTENLKKRKEIDPVRELWTEDEIEKILLKSEGWFRDCFLFLQLTGIRTIELSNLKKIDYDIQEKVLRLYSDKNSKGYRFIPVSELANEILKNRIRFIKDNDYIFTNERRNRVTTDRLNKRLFKMQKKLKMKRKTIYSLRHTYATNLCNRNINLEKVRLLLGHSQIRTTQKYVKIDFLELKKIVNGG
jgi:site-specific recombinase XerD